MDDPYRVRERVSILVLCGSFISLLMIDLAMMAGVGSINDTTEGGLYLGALFGQSALAGVFVAWAPLTLVNRSLVGMPLALWCVICLAVAFAHAGAPGGVIWISILPLAIWAAICVPLLYVRLTSDPANATWPRRSSGRSNSEAISTAKGE